MTKEPTPPTFDEILNVTLKITKLFGFTPEEQARTLGYIQPVGNNPGYLRNVLKRMNHAAVQERCEIVCVIKYRIDALFGKDHDAKIRWLRAQHVEACGESVKDLMTSGERYKLDTALHIVEAAGPLPS